MIRESVEDLGSGENMEADEKDVVGQQHESSKLIGNPALSKSIVSKVTWGLLVLVHSKDSR